MKTTFGWGAAILGFVALLLWTISMGLEVEEKVHYQWFSKASAAGLTVIPASNWLTQDDSGSRKRKASRIGLCLSIIRRSISSLMAISSQCITRDVAKCFIKTVPRKSS
jgi:hypothetical protein